MPKIDEVPRPMGKVTPVIKKVTKQLDEPQMELIHTSILPDEPIFAPQQQEDGTVLVFIKNEGVIGTGESYYVDCGVKIKYPSNFRLSARIWPDYCIRSLILSTHLVEEDRVFVVVTNVGKETICLNSGDPIAFLSLEPVFYFWGTHAS